MLDEFQFHRAGVTSTRNSYSWPHDSTREVVESKF